MSEPKKKKVLFIMQLPPPVHGVSVMSKIIKDSALINASFDCEYINLATATDISDLQKDSARKYISAFLIFAMVFYKMLTNRYFKVYITFFPYGFSFLKDAIIILVSKIFGNRPLLHLHTYGFRRFSQNSKLKQWICKLVFMKTDVICLSDVLKEDVENLHKGKVYILPNGIPKVNYENTYSIALGKVQLLYLSHLIKGKGILILMEALYLLKNSGLQFHLNVVGSEYDISYSMLETISKKYKLEDKVSLLGPKFGSEKHDEFKKAGIFILPSDYDTFGLVLLEAMQFGVPCISTNIGAIPDILGEGRGMIIPDINATELAKAIGYLIEHPEERIKMSERSFDYFSAAYTVEKFENNLQNILNC